MLKILVVDDDVSVRSYIRDMLDIEGYHVDVVADGFAALRHVGAARPDCVILDVMMPGLDGHAVLGRLRAGSADPLPVIMLTAAADDHSAWQAWSGGVDYFLAKPFDPSELLRCLDQLLAGHADAGLPRAEFA